MVLSSEETGSKQCEAATGKNVKFYKYDEQIKISETLRSNKILLLHLKVW